MQPQNVQKVQPAQTPVASPDEELLEDLGPIENMKQWLLDSGSSYLVSVAVHLVIGLIAAATMGTIVAISKPEAPEFEAPKEDPKKDEIVKLPEPFEIGNQLEPSELDMSGLEQKKDLPTKSQDEKYFTDDQEFKDEGGGQKLDSQSTDLAGSGMDIKLPGPGVVVRGGGGLGVGIGEGDNPGKGGKGTGLDGRGKGHRRALQGTGGGTKATDRAVLAALDWLSRHQNADGSWSLNHFDRNCGLGAYSGGKCNGLASVQSDAAATGMALLPFLAAGQHHLNKGPFQAKIGKAIDWMVKNQAKSGDLSAGTAQQMYTHGLATITLCEAYALSKDSRLQGPAQMAIKFIEQAQNNQDGGWRYRPGDPGDTSVVGWQLMGLKSGQMGGLAVNQATLDGTSKWLKSVGTGDYGGLYSYQKGVAVRPSMVSVGTLCAQYLGAPASSPGMQEASKYIMAHMPDAKKDRNVYYWYYATLVMHNIYDENDWDKWNREMRRVLVETQVKGGGCENGSWDPAKPVRDDWGDQGGRIYTTALSCLTLEVYYRYLPLYKSNHADDLKKRVGGDDKPADDKKDDKKADKK